MEVMLRCMINHKSCISISAKFTGIDSSMAFKSNKLTSRWCKYNSLNVKEMS